MLTIWNACLNYIDYCILGYFRSTSTFTERIIWHEVLVFLQPVMFVLDLREASSINTQDNDLLALSSFFVAFRNSRKQSLFVRKKIQSLYESFECFFYQNTEGSLSFDPVDLLINIGISFAFHSFPQNYRANLWGWPAAGFFGHHNSK